MAYTTINKHTDYFNTKLSQVMEMLERRTGVGFQPDMFIQKEEHIITVWMLLRCK